MAIVLRAKQNIATHAIRRLQWIVVVATLGLALLAPAAAQQSPAYLKDMPTVADVQRGIQGSNPAQTLGRQCAALDLLRKWRMFPFRDQETPAGLAVAESYRQGANQLRQRYAQTIKPLTDQNAQREWMRMCDNMLSGFHPLTGARDNAFPALEKRVTEAELAALFKPSVRAAYQRELQSREQLAAATKARAERDRITAEARARQAAQDNLIRGLTMVGGPLFGLALMAWMFFLTRRTAWQPGLDGKSLLIRGKTYELHQKGGIVSSHQKGMETVVSGGGGGGGPSNAPVSVTISSHTVVHQDIHLTHSDGRRGNVKLKGWDISCSPGDALQAYWFTRNGKESPDYVKVTNRSLRQSWTDGEYIKRLVTPMHPLLALLVVVLAGIGTLGIGWIAGIVWLLASRRRVNQTVVAIKQWLDQVPSDPELSYLTPATVQT